VGINALKRRERGYPRLTAQTRHRSTQSSLVCRRLVAAQGRIGPLNVGELAMNKPGAANERRGILPGCFFLNLLAGTFCILPQTSHGIAAGEKHGAEDGERESDESRLVNDGHDGCWD
jgi:hypothetical protein